MLITRFHGTQRLTLTVEFLTPTFLGGADQQAELRAAPFKNLLRQWWRVAVGSQYAAHKDMLKAEGDLFGSVLDENKACASKVRLAFNKTDGIKTSEDILDLKKNLHPEVEDKKKPTSKGCMISNALYLGYGPISTKNTRHYIQPGSKAELSLEFPQKSADEIQRILALMDAFGTLGSRSRNGWGSITLSGKSFQRQAVATLPASNFAELVNGAREYPMRLGKDGKGLLCWELRQAPQDWKVAMQELATIYMNLRTSIKFPKENPREYPIPQKRHILGYPVTNHGVDDWESKEKNGRIRRDGRMPSQLRLMVKCDEQGKLVGRILHLPHKLPKQWDAQRLGSEVAVWQEIHQLLDKNPDLRRCGGTR